MNKLSSIFFLGLLLFSSSYAYSPNNMGINAGNQEVKQRELNTKQDYDSMVQSLKEGVALGNLDSMFFLGFVYMNGITLKDGTHVKPQEDKGRTMLLRAISRGSIKALSVLTAKDLDKGNMSGLTMSVKTAQLSPQISLADKDYYSMLLASLILDVDSNDANAIEVATKWIYNAEKKRPTAKMQFILANMYAKLQNEDAANYYLNKSCKDPSMANTCREYRNNGGSNEGSCQKF